MNTEGWPNPVRMISRSAFDEAVGVLLADLDRGAGLQQAHIFDHVQDQIGDIVDRVRAVGIHPAEIDLGEIGVGAAFLGGYPHLGRGGLVVELDPEAVEQFLGRFSGQRAVCNFLFDRRGIGAGRGGRGKGVPGVQLGGDAQVDEPVVLDCFPELRGAWAGTWLQTSAIFAVPAFAWDRFPPRPAARACSAWRSAKRMIASAADLHCLELLAAWHRPLGR